MVAPLLLLLLLAVVLASFPGASFALRGPSPHIKAAAEEASHLKIWASRRKIVTGALSLAVGVRNIRSALPVLEPNKANDTDEAPDPGRAALVSSAAALVGGAALIRFGGRAALVQMLGLDFSADEGIEAQIRQGLSLLENMPNVEKFIAFQLAWIASKTFCVDFVSFVLALISGLVWGGPLQGALLSSFCAMNGSAVGFALARTRLRERVVAQLEQRPALRAVEKAIAREGFKTVLTLRLSPILPIPLGAYSYIYGITTLRTQEFLLGTFLGSFKPYLFDSYLGMLGKGMIDPSGGIETSDAVIVAVLVLAVLVGSFAGEIAGATWEEVRAEVAKEEGTDEGDQGVLSWLQFWGLNKSDLPEGVRLWEDNATEARDLFRLVADEEWKRRQGEFESNADVAPCPPPRKENGSIDYGRYLVESLMLNVVVLEILTKYSEKECV
jgi:uncharacterized membrane protein YdjX (TVP38/TMEM64 family)